MDAKFVNAVQNGNLVRVRFALSNELLLDPRGNTFHEMKRFAESKLSELYQKDDDRKYDLNHANWTMEFLQDLKNDLDLNFSHEKLSLYELVVSEVLKEKAKQLSQEEEIYKQDASSAESSAQSTNRETPDKKTVSIGLVIGGTVLATIGLCCSKPLLTTIGVIRAVAGGVSLLYGDEK